MSGDCAAVMPEITENTRVLVLGLGKSGISAVKFLQALGARVSVSDAGSINDHAPLIDWLHAKQIACEFGGHTPEFCLSADLILVSPGVPLKIAILQEARKAGIPVRGELALATRYLKTPVVAVTGTNGKTTVTTLIGDLFAASGKKTFVGGNIGVPLTDYLAGEQDADWVVLEVSSFQLDTAGDFRPDIGLLLNVSPDHLDRYDSYEDYIASKLQLFRHQGQGDAAIVAAADEAVLQEVGRRKSKGERLAARGTYCFGSALEGRCGAAYGEGVVRLHAVNGCDGEEYSLTHTSLALAPNLQNGAAAILAARLAGCSIEGIKKGLAAFTPLPHRMSFVAERAGVVYIDDSKATNIGAVCAALEAMSRPVILIAGGRDKGGDYRLMQELVGKKVKALLLIGEAREMMAAAFTAVTSVACFDSMAEAVAGARAQAQAGDIVLLSPACASFDMFDGYAHRGEVFQECVRTLSL